LVASQATPRKFSHFSAHGADDPAKIEHVSASSWSVRFRLGGTPSFRGNPQLEIQLKQGAGIAMQPRTIFGPGQSGQRNC
jgi:hypothetical protein